MWIRQGVKNKQKMIIVQHKSRMLASIKKKWPNSEVIDVTSKGPDPFVKFSPFYPIGNIPVPFSEGYVAQSVEGIWQGLKVFETAGIDTDKFDNDTMKRLKRTQRRFGRTLGHQKGVHSEELLGYIEARKAIYLPIYFWVLDNHLSELLEKLRDIALEKDLILLDYETNGDVDNPAKPLSHAALVKMKLAKLYPEVKGRK